MDGIAQEVDAERDMKGRKVMVVGRTREKV